MPVSGLFSVLWNRYIKHVDRNKIKTHEPSYKVNFLRGFVDTELNVPRNIHFKIQANFTWMQCSILLLKWTSLTMKTIMLSGGHHSNGWWPLDGFFSPATNGLPLKIHLTLIIELIITKLKLYIFYFIL